MSKRLTIDFVRSSFEKEGYTLLTEIYVNNQQNLEYICPVGHKGSISWCNWKSNRRCKFCAYRLFAFKKKLTIEFIREEFKKENYTLLTKEYTGNHQKLEYICPSGHLGSVTRNNWTNGHRCAECSGNKRLTIAFIRDEFKKEGYILLTKEYTGNKRKLEYICSKGHNGSITWHDWVQSRRCKKCWYENNKGKNHPNWNSNKTDKERRLERRRPGCKAWADQIKKRDNNTCRVCKQKINLEVHHLESYNNNPELRTELSNGITLCEKCHKDFHHNYGYGNNTREQFNKFKNNIGNKNV